MFVYLVVAEVDVDGDGRGGGRVIFFGVIILGSSFWGHLFWLPVVAMNSCDCRATLNGDAC